MLLRLTKKNDDRSIIYLNPEYISYMEEKYFRGEFMWTSIQINGDEYREILVIERAELIAKISNE